MKQEPVEQESNADMSNHSSHVIAKDEPHDVDVLKKQQKRQSSPTVNAQDYDDPQAGPSGIKQEAHRNVTDCHSKHFYTKASASSSDDDSDDDREIMQTTTLWRSRGTLNLNQTSRPSINNRDLDEDQLHNRTTSAAVAESASTSGNDVNRIVTSLRPEINRTTSEILTAPDLQLDWLSDSSGDSEQTLPPTDVTTEIQVNPEMTGKTQTKWQPCVCVPLSSSSAAVDEANVEAESRSATVTNEPSLQIDLTTSDDEDVMEINVNVFNDGAETRSPRLPPSPVRVPVNRLRHALYDEYHNRESHVGHLNCRSAYSTCDCLEATK